MSDPRDVISAGMGVVEVMTDPREVVAGVLEQSYQQYCNVSADDDWLCDAIIAALDAAGLVVVERERFERLIRGGAKGVALNASRHGGMIQKSLDELGFQPGDLDPLSEMVK